MADDIVADPPFKSHQARRVADCFGGVTALAREIGRDPSNVWRWTKPDGVTRGLVPSSMVPTILLAAERLGIDFEYETWYPLP